MIFGTDCKLVSEERKASTIKKNVAWLRLNAGTTADTETYSDKLVESVQWLKRRVCRWLMDVFLMLMQSKKLLAPLAESIFRESQLDNSNCKIDKSNFKFKFNCCRQWFSLYWGYKSCKDTGSIFYQFQKISEIVYTSRFVRVIQVGYLC